MPLPRRNDPASTFRNLDWPTVLIYLIMVFAGMVSIYAACYNFDNASMFSFDEFSGKQLRWIGLSVCLGIVLLLVDARMYETYAYPLYVFLVILLAITPFVAPSLGIYYAERNTGAFQNHFITFSENPKLVEIKGKDIYEKVRYCHQFNEVANTNIQRVFELILKTAVKNRVPQKDMPAKIFIISDMEFDYCTEDCSLTNFEYAQRLFEEHGYQLPEVMFWNVASRNQQQPVKINDQGVALVSGCNPRIFSMLKAGILSPYAFMMDVLGSERYAAIVA